MIQMNEEKTYKKRKTGEKRSIYYVFLEVGNKCQHL